MDVNKYIEKINCEHFDEFLQFKNLLLEYNAMYNLTSVLDEKGIMYKHFLDSAVGESYFPQSAAVVEIGSGGGFPSIPLKIIRKDLKFDLIESTGKKCAYLNKVVENLHLDCVQVRNIRAEEGGRDKNLREKFDIACARAVARLNTLAEYCLPYVKVGGRFIAYKGDCEDEVAECQNALKVLGGKILDVVHYELPEDFGKRTLVVIEKVKHTPEKYPRGHGSERKNPL
jgi:16S rRNA (guanine527-N7)-methyltransferase